MSVMGFEHGPIGSRHKLTTKPGSWLVKVVSELALGFGIQCAQVQIPELTQFLHKDTVPNRMYPLLLVYQFNNVVFV